jgi:hypothetical protein
MGVSGQRHALAALCPGERTPSTHCTGGWVGLRAGLDTEVRGKILCFCRGSNPNRLVIQSVVRHYTDWATPAPFCKEGSPKLTKLQSPKILGYKSGFITSSFSVVHKHTSDQTILVWRNKFTREYVENWREWVLRTGKDWHWKGTNGRKL